MARNFSLLQTEGSMRHSQETSGSVPLSIRPRNCAYIMEP
jgi:hypothetical protein